MDLIKTLKTFMRQLGKPQTDWILVSIKESLVFLGAIRYCGYDFEVLSSETHSKILLMKWCDDGLVPGGRADEARHPE